MLLGSSIKLLNKENPKPLMAMVVVCVKKVFLALHSTWFPE